MLVVQTPALIITLPIVILIEGLICSKLLQIPKKSAFRAATIANLASTIIGFPFVWFAMVVVQMLAGGGGVSNLTEPWFSIYSVTAQAAWLIPYEDKLYWMVPTAMLVLLVPTFFMSVFIERFLYLRCLRAVAPNANFQKSSWKLNLASYAFLSTMGFILLAYALLTHTKTSKHKNRSHNNSANMSNQSLERTPLGSTVCMGVPGMVSLSSSR